MSPGQEGPIHPSISLSFLHPTSSTSSLQKYISSLLPAPESSVRLLHSTTIITKPFPWLFFLHPSLQFVFPPAEVFGFRHSCPPPPSGTLPPISSACTPYLPSSTLPGLYLALICAQLGRGKRSMGRPEQYEGQHSNVSSDLLQLCPKRDFSGFPISPLHRPSN